MPFFAFIFSLFLAFFNSIDAEYIMPLPLEPRVSGSFGEYRRGHFHQGLDFRTYTLNGIPILASKAGSLYKIIGSNINYGFGQALYLRHPNNTFSVYGHLNHFAPLYSLEAGYRLYGLMTDKSSFSVELPPEQFTVRQGQVVAFSGEKGSGPAHLHFEIRDSKFNAMNPLKPGLLKIDDKDPPVVDKVYITTHKRVVKGKKGTVQACSLKKQRDKRQFKCRQSIPVDGLVYFRLRGYDQLNSYNKLGINRMRVEVDGKVIFKVDFEKIETSIVKREQEYYDLTRTSLSPTYYTYNLFWRSRNNRATPIYIKKHENFGWLDTSKWPLGKKKTVKIVASDYSDNEVAAYIQIKKAKSRHAKSRKVTYNRQRGSVVRASYGKVKVSSAKLLGPAFLSIKKTSTRLPSYLKAKGGGYQISWRSSKGQALFICLKTGSWSNKLFYKSGRMVRRTSYDKRKGCYEFKTYRSTSIFVARDISSPKISLPFALGPLENQHVSVVIKDSGTGFSLYSSKIYLNGIKLSHSELQRWGVYYDRARRSLLFPTGNNPQLTQAISGRLHELWIIASDATGNKSKKWRGYINLKS